MVVLEPGSEWPAGQCSATRANGKRENGVWTKKRNNRLIWIDGIFYFDPGGTFSRQSVKSNSLQRFVYLSFSIFLASLVSQAQTHTRNVRTHTRTHTVVTHLSLSLSLSLSLQV